MSAAIDEAMAAVILEEGATLRTAGALAGLSENAVGPRLARTRDLGAYSGEAGRVTAKGVERALYDLERGSHQAAEPAAAPSKTRTDAVHPKETHMTDTTSTHLYFLLDRSGSMQSIRTDTTGGFDAFIEEQRALPGAAG